MATSDQGRPGDVRVPNAGRMRGSTVNQTSTNIDDLVSEARSFAACDEYPPLTGLLRRLADTLADRERLISDAPRTATLLPPEFQRLWESCNTLVEKADFKFVFRHIEQLEAELRRLHEEIRALKGEPRVIVTDDDGEAD
ncbi:hypothetical protein [Singulisphaera sp. PoT]|uniref:hypothetical protein n=1 Tax=Singulisphaera sp. PoT TaxID=3411797 RepID=UPI003BF51A61